MAKKAQSTLINMLLSLTLITIVAGAALAFVNSITEEPIKQTESKKKEEAIKAVLPEYADLKYDTIADLPCCFAVDNEGNMVGMAVETFSEKGFNGRIGVMVGFTTDTLVYKYQIIQSGETPGLGAKADNWFQEGSKGSVINKKPVPQLAVTKDGGSVEAISGSTITSRAFCDAINRAYNALNKGE